MKTAITQINTRAFDCELLITLKNPDFMNLHECEKYVRKHIIDTAEVISIIHKDDTGDRIIKNQKFVVPVEMIA